MPLSAILYTAIPRITRRDAQSAPTTVRYQHENATEETQRRIFQMFTLIKNIIFIALIIIAIAVFLVICLGSMIWFFARKLYRRIVPVKE